MSRSALPGSPGEGFFMPAARDFTTVPNSTVQKMQVTCRWRLAASGSYADRKCDGEALVAHMWFLVPGGEQPGTYGSGRAARGSGRAAYAGPLRGEALAPRRCGERRATLVTQCGQQCGQPAQTKSKTAYATCCIFQIGEGNRGSMYSLKAIHAVRAECGQ